MFGVAGLGPVLDNLTGAGFGAAAGRDTRRTGSTTARRRGLGLGSGRSRGSSLPGDKMMVIVMMNVMLANTGGDITSDVAGRDPAPDAKACARRQQTSAG